jgi:hypothetical protein
MSSQARACAQTYTMHPLIRPKRLRAHPLRREWLGGVRDPQFDISKKINISVISNGFESSISSGNWSVKRFKVERKGVTQVQSYLDGRVRNKWVTHATCLTRASDSGTNPSTGACRPSCTSKARMCPWHCVAEDAHACL